MQVRLAKLTQKTAMAAGNTAIFEAPDNGFLSGIMILGYASTVKASTYTQEAWRPADLIDPIKVKLNEGFDAVSISGQQAIAFNYWDKALADIAWLRMYSTGTTRFVLPIPFGKYMFDPEYAINLELVDSCKVEITNSMSASTFTSPSCVIYGIFFDEPNVSLMKNGFFRKQEFREWTTVQAATEYIDLPTKGKLRRILFQAIPDLTLALPDDNAHDGMDNIRYTIKGGQRVLYNNSMFDLIHLNTLDRGREVWVSGLKDTTADYGVIHGMLRSIGMAGISTSEDGAVSSNVPTFDDRQSYAYKPEDRESDSPVQFIGRGIGCEATAMYRHDYYPDLSDLLDLAVNRGVALEITTEDAAAAANGTNRVIIDRLWTEYPD